MQPRSLNTGTTDLRRLATEIRYRALRMVEPQGFGYLGQALSAAEQIAAVYGRHLRPGVDRFVCSPGHYIVGVYAVAGALGRLGDDDLATYGQDGSKLEAIGTESSPVVDLTCGSLATGLSGAVGFALADVVKGLGGADVPRNYALISDGELQEGQLWEAALFAAHHGLGRVTALLDANDSQVDGPVSGITGIEPVAEKWAAFGWHVQEVDGHDVDAVDAALERAATDPRPSVIVARTSTVHGLDCLPPDADGHFIKLPPALAAAARQELEARLA